MSPLFMKGFAIWLAGCGLLFAWMLGGAFYCLGGKRTIGPFEGIGRVFSLPVLLWLAGGFACGLLVFASMIWSAAL